MKTNFVKLVCTNWYTPINCDCKKKYTGHAGRNLTKYLKDIFFLLRITTTTTLSCLNICYKTATHLEILITLWKSYSYQKGKLLDTGEKLSHYLTNSMHKICFTISFISCLYMFRAHVLKTCRGMK